MVVWNICLQMGQEEKNVADQSLGKRWNLLAWLQDKQIGSPNLPPLVVSQIITREWCCGQEAVSTTSCVRHAACMLSSLPWYTAHPLLPFMGEHPTPPHWVDFIPNTCWERLKCPLSLGFLFFFPFRVFKVKPTKSKILWILPNYNLWRCITDYPSIIKSYAIKILRMSFWREKDVLFVFFFPFLVLQETYPHFRNTKLVYIEA